MYMVYLKEEVRFMEEHEVQLLGQTRIHRGGGGSPTVQKMVLCYIPLFLDPYVFNKISISSLSANFFWIVLLLFTICYSWMPPINFFGSSPVFVSITK